MTPGDRVRIVAPGSVFHERLGTVRQVRKGLLPIGVKVDTHRGGLIWCSETELEAANG